MEGFQPFREGFPGEDLEVTCIEAESALGRIQGRQQSVQLPRSLLVNVFQDQPDGDLLRRR